MKLTWFLEPNNVLQGSCLYQRNNVTSLTSVQALSTRRNWCERVSLLIPHRHFVSKSVMVSAVLCTLIISLMLPLSRLRHQSPEKRCSSEQYSGMYIVQSLDLVDVYLPAAHASKRYSANSGEYPERYALGVARYATRAVKWPGYF